jgi:uncharacterized protein YndB with AHSA1/START domain
MYKEFEVGYEGVLHAAPEHVWDAITLHAGGWLWPVDYERRLGGAAGGLGTVTAWEPYRRLVTRAERPDGWTNQLEYELAPGAGGVTLLRYRHNGVLPEAEYDVQLDGCRQHTAFYNHSLGEYVRRFAGRDASYASVEAPGTFAEVRAALGVPADADVGDDVTIGPDRAGGVVDYATHAFLGVRTGDALVRVYGREAWGMGVEVAQHGFGARTAIWLDEVFVGAGKVA